MDFGPFALDPAGIIPEACRVEGATPGKLRAQLRLLCPRQPGIYGMIDGEGELLYVGKAKSLRARLFSYFRRRGRPAKATRIIRRTATIAWEVWRGEFAALLRELELIRRWRPRGNVQGQPLRRRQTFVCLGRRPAPTVYHTRKPPRTALGVFGPVPLSMRTVEAVRRLNDHFRLRDCPEKQEMIFPDQGELFPANRTPGCLRYEFGTCLAPCAGLCTRRDYQSQVRAARAFLEGRDDQTLAEIDAEMQTASLTQAFERAAALRDKRDALAWLSARLERLREARERYSFIYPHGGWWFLIHAGRTLTAIPAPKDAAAIVSGRKLIKRIFLTPGHDGLLDSHEHIDGLMLVSAWFRKHPRELRRVLTPQDALARISSTKNSASKA